MIPLALVAHLFTSSGCVEAASEALTRGDENIAAVQAELCWQQWHDIEALLVACQARVRLGHHAHAARALSLYFRHAPADLSTWLRAAARALRADIAAGTGTLRLELIPKPQDDEKIRIAFTHLEREAPALHTTLAELDPLDGQPTHPLDRGRWRLTVRRPGFEPVQADVVIDLHTTAALRLRTRPLVTPVAVKLPVQATTLALGPRRAVRRGVTLRLRPADDPSAAPRLHIARDRTFALHLPPGRWLLAADAPGFAATHTTVTAGTPADLHLSREP